MRQQIEAVQAQVGAKRFADAIEKARAIWLATGEAPVRVDDASKAFQDSWSNESVDPSTRDAARALEAIILAELRPAFYVIDDAVDLKAPIEPDPDLKRLISTNASAYSAAIKAVGRVDLRYHPDLAYAGTGWLVDDNIVVTNAHVAKLFASLKFGTYEFRAGVGNEPIEAQLDLKREIKSEERRRVDVRDILYIAGEREPDIALLKVSAPNGGLAPIPLLQKRPSARQPIAAIGYPAKDLREVDLELMDLVFGATYQVKRFSPGYVTGAEDDGIVITSDYSSLGGNSGSAVIDLESGDVIGLHFAGKMRTNNYAVAADLVTAARREARTFMALSDRASHETPTTPADWFKDRDGYKDDFLGTDCCAVPLPALGGWASDIAAVSDNADGVLKYRHFSVIQSQSRRLPLVTAVNIDGAKSMRLKRKGSWRLDGRLDEKHQIGNELYFKNRLDRGHMVRRRDPGGGDERRVAAEAEKDTFHYTNSAPQHEGLNQKHWLGLEDYILEAAETKDFKVSVFTGPIFRDTDRALKRQRGAEGIRIPEEFWKIAVIVSEDTGELCASGYVLSHGPMIRDLVESAFIYGQYRTYQVQIALIERETGLSFHNLRSFDPLGADLGAESIFGQSAKEITGADSIQL